MYCYFAIQGIKHIKMFVNDNNGEHFDRIKAKHCFTPLKNLKLRLNCL